MTEDQMVIMEILQSMAEREMVGPPGSADWLPRVSGAVAQLPWRETNLPDGRRPPQPRAAAGLMILLAKLLKSGTAAPGSVNVSWAGGVGVEWHTCKLGPGNILRTRGDGRIRVRGPGNRRATRGTGHRGQYNAPQSGGKTAGDPATAEVSV